jgi:hypothetical protein
MTAGAAACRLRWGVSSPTAGHRAKEGSMCMSCGCGEPNQRHKPGDITLDDLKKAASNHDLQVEQAADYIHDAARKMKQAGQIS